MKVFYDTEFIERGAGLPIDLISIGMIRDSDQGVLYAVNADAPWHAIRENQWLLDNVLAYLPRDERYDNWQVDLSHPAVMSHAQIAAEVTTFCLPGQWVQDSIVVEPDTQAELYAWYADYDHVVLSQLFGRMIDLPSHMPMYTRDVKQMADQLAPGLRFPDQVGTEHHALADAHDCRAKFFFLKSHLDGIGALDPWQVHL